MKDGVATTARGSILASAIILWFFGTPAAHAQAPFFGPPAALNSDAATDSATDLATVLTTDTQGTWIAVWSAFDLQLGFELDLYFARSTDSGASWTAPATLNSNAATDSGSDRFPQLATDGEGTWIAVWDSSESLGASIGSDFDILVSRSVDDGATWTAPAALNSNASLDSGNDLTPQLTTDGQGNWIAVWASFDSLNGSIGTDFDILVARSVDDGVSWSGPVALNSNATLDAGNDLNPQLATDGQGTWVAVWDSDDTLGGTLGTDVDALTARSTDNGSSWSTPLALHDNASTDAGDDQLPHLTTDRQGTWVAVWDSNEPVGGTLGTDCDILVARSTTGGSSWSAPTAIHASAATDSGDDFGPRVTTDTNGSWHAVWESADTLGGTIGSDFDLLGALSSDSGSDWTQPSPINTNAANDSGDDRLPALATDQQGTWIAVWDSDDSLDNTIGTDLDILVAVPEPSVAWLRLAALAAIALLYRRVHDPILSGRL